MRRTILNMLRGNSGDPYDPTIKYGSIIFADRTFVVQIVGENIEMSSDSGVNFDTTIPIPPDIPSNEMRMFYVFSNGRAVCAGHRTAWYTVDWSEWLPCDIRSLNGNVWSPSLEHDNFSPFNQPGRFTFENKECLMFSNYNNSENANGSNVAGRSWIWYTDNFGETLKIVFQLGTPPINMIARHIHTVSQDPYTGQVYFDTGDEAREVNSHWGRGTYNNGAFTWQSLGSGNFRKTVGIHYDAEYIYGVLDTEFGGLIRYVRGQEGNTANVQQILTTINDCAGAVFGKSGSCCVHQLTWNNSDIGHVLWYSRDKINWTRIVVQPEDLPQGWNRDTVFVHSGNVMDNGKAMIMCQINGQTAWPAFPYAPSVWLDDLLRKYGFGGAFL